MNTPTFIDKLALIEIQNRKLLCTRSKGQTAWFLPGGKREADETDEQALTRECSEELGIHIQPGSPQLYGVFQAQAHGKPPGTMVRITCYTARYSGTLQPLAEIEELGWLTHADKPRTTATSFLLFDNLKSKNLID